jgi:hypothetical protein
MGGGCFLGAGRYDLTGLVSGFEITFLVALTRIVMPAGAWWQFWLWRKQLSSQKPLMLTALARNLSLRLRTLTDFVGRT